MSTLECPICAATRHRTLVEREAVPVMQNKRFASAEAARGSDTGALRFVQCGGCGFVWNAAFEPAKVVYDPDYENCQTCSPAFQQHLAERVARVAALADAATTGNQLALVEVGCGQGDFLAATVAALGLTRKVSAVGFDPAFHGQDGDVKGGCRIYKRYLSPSSLEDAGISPSLVVSRHTIEHIDRPLEFLRMIRRSLGDAQASLVLETPTSSWILRNGVMHDFFYEHCSLFDVRSMAEALSRAGFEATSIGEVFGGQYLWVEARVAHDAAPPGRDAFAAYRERWTAQVTAWTDAGHTIAVWGAGAKGVTFAGMVDPAGQRIDCVVDRNVAKQGHFLPMTGHPIVAPARIAARGVTHVLVMNPEYLAEIEAEIRDNGLSARCFVVE